MNLTYKKESGLVPKSQKSMLQLQKKGIKDYADEKCMQMNFL